MNEYPTPTPEQLELIEKSRKEYREFMDNYNLQRKACPKCGSTSYSTTLVAYIMFSDNREAYQDKNACECLNCGDKHIFHNRVPATKTNNNEKKN